MLKFRINVAVFLLLAAAGALADPLSQDDLSWLKKMVFAAHQTDYSGTFIYQSGNYIETSRITHLTDGKNEDERLEGLDGERSEIIRKNDQVWCYLGDSKVMVANREGARTFPALLPGHLALLQENYLIRHGEEDRVAGFHAHSLIFQPKDKMRYSHKMWANSDSGLLLKAVVLDEHEHVIEQYAFTQLNIGGDIDRKWIVPNKSTDQNASGNVASNPVARTIAKESGWQVYSLPAGFKKMTEVSRSLRGSHLPVTHLVYSDGLAGISVFIEKLGNKSDAKPGLYSKGAIQVFIKVLDDNLITVVGEVPPRTVMQVAESVRYGGQQ
jgi:sigma-E factor negative regulatory protein RseB